ncbi:MAG: hypothetical protein IPG57_03130 [Burkholderiales bacterium]|nr:hypothetical protein [Burkholderiales bacterium]
MKLGGFAKVLAGKRQVVTPYNPPPALTLPLNQACVAVQVIAPKLPAA